MGNEGSKKPPAAAGSFPRDASGEFQKIDLPAAGKTSPTVETETLLAASVTPLSSSTAAAANTPSRRIIKGTAPTAGGGRGGSDLTPSKDAVDAASGDDRGSGKKQHLPPVLSPKASSELLEESLVQSKTKRMQNLTKVQKSNRDRAVGERRKQRGGGSTAGGGGDDDDAAATSGGGCGGGGRSKTTPQANPFSKFLSAFSVEPARPDHKRAYPRDGGGKTNATTTTTSEGSVEDGAAALAGATGAIATAAIVTTTSGDIESEPKRMKLEGDEDIAKQHRRSEDEDGDAAATVAKSTENATTVYLNLASTFLESLPPWAGMVGAAAVVAGVAFWVTKLLKK